MSSRIFNLTSVFLLLIFIIIALTSISIYFLLRNDEVSVLFQEVDVSRTLLVLHNNDEVVFSFVLLYAPDTNRAAVLNIQNNVGIVLQPQNQVNAISSTFSAENSMQFQEYVGVLIGKEIHFALIFSLQQMRNFIDLIGGIEIFVIDDENNEDSSNQSLLPFGNIVLDGAKAVQFLSLSTSNETAARRHQVFAQSLLREIRKNLLYFQHSEVRNVRNSIIHSSLNDRALNVLFAGFEKIDAERIIRRQIQGNTRIVSVDNTDIALLFPHFEGEWLRQSVQQVEKTLSGSEVLARDGVPIVLEILNGTNTTGLARRTSELFETFGFEVRRFANAESSDVENTVVIDRRGIEDFAQRTAKIIHAANIHTEVIPNSDVDVTLILGADFDGIVIRAKDQY